MFCEIPFHQFLERPGFLFQCLEKPPLDDLSPHLPQDRLGQPSVRRARGSPHLPTVIHKPHAPILPAFNEPHSLPPFRLGSLLVWFPRGQYRPRAWHSQSGDRRLWQALCACSCWHARRSDRHVTFLKPVLDFPRIKPDDAVDLHTRNLALTGPGVDRFLLHLKPCRPCSFTVRSDVMALTQP